MTAHTGERNGPTNRMPRAGPLAGLRVLEFGHVLAGPLCGRRLADFGADVVKVESASRPDLARRLGPYPPGREGDLEASGLYLSANAGKRAIALDLQTESGRAIARLLAARCDVLLENYRPGVLARLGLGYPELAVENPRLIYASLSGFGATGPRARWGAVNAVLQAVSGLQALTGRAGQPSGLANSWADYIGGLHGLFAILAALEQRASTGQGCWLDVSLFEANVASIGAAFYEEPLKGDGPPVPYGCYPCRGEDRWCAISVATTAQWEGLLRALGRPELATDPRYVTAAARAQRADDLDALVAEWTCNRPVDVAVAHLQAEGVPAWPVARIDDLAPPGRVLDGRAFVLQNHPGVGPAGIAGTLATFERTPLAPPPPAPRVGEGGVEVLCDWLGWDEPTATAALAAC